MLKQRVITALILVSVFLAALFLLPAAGWGLFVAAIVLVAAHEWRGLSGMDMPSVMVLGVVSAVPAVLVGFGLFALENVWPLFAVGVVFWCCVAPLLLRTDAVLNSAWRRWLVFAMLLVPASVAMVMIRNQHGPVILLYVMAAVWLADIAAYFVGRSIGRRKLAPRISPGKSQEGALAGIVAVVAYAGLLVALDARVAALASLWPTLLAAAIFAVLSIEGDLFESLLKRQAGVKDSGSLLPGHGGVLDRIDSLTSTLPFAGLLLLL